MIVNARNASITQPVDRWSTLSESALRQYAALYDDQYPPDHPGYCDPQNARWSYDPQYDLTRIGGSTQAWALWLQQEHQWAKEDGNEGRLSIDADLLVEEFYDPIVLFIRDLHCYLWDGNHRVAAAHIRGLQYLKAIVGTPADILP